MRRNAAAPYAWHPFTAADLLTKRARSVAHKLQLSGRSYVIAAIHPKRNTPQRTRHCIGKYRAMQHRSSAEPRKVCCVLRHNARSRTRNSGNTLYGRAAQSFWLRPASSRSEPWRTLCRSDRNNYRLLSWLRIQKASPGNRAAGKRGLTALHARESDRTMFPDLGRRPQLRPRPGSTPPAVCCPWNQDSVPPLLAGGRTPLNSPHSLGTSMISRPPNAACREELDHLRHDIEHRMGTVLSHPDLASGKRRPRHERVKERTLFTR